MITDSIATYKSSKVTFVTDVNLCWILHSYKYLRRVGKCAPAVAY